MYRLQCSHPTWQLISSDAFATTTCCSFTSGCFPPGPREPRLRASARLMIMSGPEARGPRYAETMTPDKALYVSVQAAFTSGVKSGPRPFSNVQSRAAPTGA